MTHLGTGWRVVAARPRVATCSTATTADTPAWPPEARPTDDDVRCARRCGETDRDEVSMRQLQPSEAEYHGRWCCCVCGGDYRSPYYPTMSVSSSGGLISSPVHSDHGACVSSSHCHVTLERAWAHLCVGRGIRRGDEGGEDGLERRPPLALALRHGRQHLHRCHVTTNPTYHPGQSDRPPTLLVP